MKTKLLCTIFLFFSSTPMLFCQDKAPVAEDDFASAQAPQTIAIHATANDFAYDGHSFKIFQAFGAHGGSSTFNDTMIFYTPNLYFQGIDSLKYRIIDLQNMMFSEFAAVYIDVQNKGFGFLDVNEVKCEINSSGNQFWNQEDIVTFEVPAGSGVNSIFNQTFWIGGMDEYAELHLAGERYRQVGTDFFPGPVMNIGSYSDSLDVIWHRVWKLNSEEIEYHRAHWQDSGYEPIENIAAWPGNGEVSLGQAAKLAPYFDWDGDCLYDPMQGDFPLTKGNQCIFGIYNDDRSEHSESGGKKLGVEIQELWYAYDQPDDSALKYTVFCNMNIINRSDTNYSEVMTGHFMDFDLGSPWDDYIGCDTLLNSGYCYNGNPVDGSGGAGTYDVYPPAQSFTCLNFKMNGFSSFISYGTPALSDPYSAHEYYNYLNSRWKDSTNLTYGGNGYGGDSVVKFIYPGDPVSNEGWTEINAENQPGDRRGLISSGPYNLAAGDTLNFEFALVFARDYEGDNISSISLLRERIGLLKGFYENSLGFEKPSVQTEKVEVFPNPVSDVLFVKSGVKFHNCDYELYDILGMQVASGKIENETISSIPVAGLKQGLYFLRLSYNGRSLTKKVIKN